MSKSTDLAKLIRKAAALDLEIKALSTERDEAKEQIKTDVGENWDTYVGEGGYTAAVARFTSFNAALAQSVYGTVEGATEPKVTPASLKAYLQTKHPKKWQEKLDEFYNVGSRVTFGQLS
jgi:hypothetical protein